MPSQTPPESGGISSGRRAGSSARLSLPTQITTTKAPISSSVIKAASMTDSAIPQAAIRPSTATTATRTTASGNPTKSFT
jgi:hypothetical protein